MRRLGSYDAIWEDKASVVTWSDNPNANNKIKHLAMGMTHIPEIVLRGIVNIPKIARVKILQVIL